MDKNIIPPIAQMLLNKLAAVCPAYTASCVGQIKNASSASRAAQLRSE